VHDREGPEEVRGRRQGLSIEELAAGLGKSVRSLRRWNNRPDAPERVKQGRRLMYGREDVRHWLEQSRGDGGDDTLGGDETL
jgi:predicted DNA-binding transcriptional regulator AlpA